MPQAYDPVDPVARPILPAVRSGKFAEALKRLRPAWRCQDSRMIRRAFIILLGLSLPAPRRRAIQTAAMRIRR
jgi:hypothetical protein